LDGYTYSLNQQSERKQWRFQSNAYSIYPLATESASLLFSADFDGRVYALDKRTGEEKWRFTTPSLVKTDTEPIISQDLVYFGSRNGILYALDKNTGEKKWEFKTQGIQGKELDFNQPIIHFGVFLIDKQNIYLNSASDNAIYALDKRTGEEKWRFNHYQYVHEKPMLGLETISFYSADGYFYTLDKETGGLQWKWPIKDREWQSAFVQGNEIYYVDEDNDLHKFVKGKLTAQWIYKNDDLIPDIRERLIVEKGKIYLITFTGGSGGKVLALDQATGEPFWQFETQALIDSVLKLDNQLVYFVSGGDLHCLDKKTGQSQWVFKGVGSGHALFLTEKEVYLINLDSGKMAMVYFLNKANGQLKWYLENAKVIPETFKVKDERIYFLADDKKSFYALSQNNQGKVELADLPRVNLSAKKELSGYKAKGLIKRAHDSFLSSLSVFRFIRFKGWFVSRQNKQVQVKAEDKEIDSYEVYEISLAHDDSFYKNVWQEVDILVEFKNEAGEIFKVNGFYYDKNTWKVRFAPPEPGQWHWQLVFKSFLTKEIAKETFKVKESNQPGFVRIHPTNPYRFVFDNGQLFKPLGMQDCFIDINHTGDLLGQLNVGMDQMPLKDKNQKQVNLEQYLDIYGPKGAGFNLFRFNVDNCSEKLWQGEDLAGSYGVNQGIRGDELVQTLKKKGFRIWMSLFSFRLPLAGSVKNQEEQDLVKDYLDYAVARYGAYVDIWELANEISLDREWIEFAAEYLRQIDPYQHPLTVNWERPDLEPIEINSLHWYESEDELASDLVVSRKIHQAKKWQKPVVFSEIGNQGVNWDKNSALRLRLRLWTAFFEEAALIFWNTSSGLYRHEENCANIYLGPQERNYTQVLQDFIKKIGPDLKKEELDFNHKAIRSYGLKSSQELLAYFHHFENHRQTVNFSLKLSLPQKGTLEWVDPATGMVLKKVNFAAGEKLITSPLFKIDLALKISFD